MDDALVKEAKQAGFKVAGDRNDLFGQVEEGEFAVGGVVNYLDIHVCAGFQYVDPNATKAVPPKFKGTLSMKVEWQIYSRLEKRVVATTTTSGATELKNVDEDGIALLFRDAMADNARALINTEAFRTAFVGASRPAGQKIVATPNARIALTNTTADAM